jgi:type VI secretion system protein
MGPCERRDARRGNAKHIAFLRDLLLFESPIRDFASLLTVVLGCLLFLSACSTGQKVRGMFGGQLPVQVTVQPGANDNSAIAVDMVVVYDQKLLDDLMKMPASDWFSKRPQMIKDFGNSLSVSGWEWIPGQAVAPFAIPYHSGARKIVLFADYRTQGEHRAAVDPQQTFHLVLGESDLALEAP